MNSRLPRIGFVGLGNQGEPIAERIIAGGFPLLTWSRRELGSASIAALGAEVATDLASLAKSVDILCICVLDDTGVIDVVTKALPSLASGSLIVILSTAHPQTCRALAEQAKSRDIEVIDAPVSGGAGGARAGTMTVMLGGAPDTCSRIDPVLRTFASTIIRLGDVGAGQVAKLVNNTLLAANLALAHEAVTMAERLGLDRGETLRVLASSSGRSFAMDIIAGLPRLADFSAGAALLNKDVTLLAELTPDSAGGSLIAEAQRFIAHVVDAAPQQG